MPVTLFRKFPPASLKRLERLAINILSPRQTKYPYAKVNSKAGLI